MQLLQAVCNKHKGYLVQSYQGIKQSTLCWQYLHFAKLFTVEKFCTKYKLQKILSILYENWEQFIYLLVFTIICQTFLKRWILTALLSLGL